MVSLQLPASFCLPKDLLEDSIYENGVSQDENNNEVSIANSGFKSLESVDFNRLNQQTDMQEIIDVFNYVNQAIFAKFINEVAKEQNTIANYNNLNIINFLNESLPIDLLNSSDFSNDYDRVLNVIGGKKKLFKENNANLFLTKVNAACTSIWSSLANWSNPLEQDNLIGELTKNNQLANYGDLLADTSCITYDSCTAYDEIWSPIGENANLVNDIKVYIDIAKVCCFPFNYFRL